LLFIPVERVVRLSSEKNYVEVHTADARYLVRGTLESFTGRLDPEQFVQLRRSDVVNLDAVKELRPWFHGEYLVTLKDGTELTWTRRYLRNAPMELLKGRAD
jgi:two-component system LytT family response regulator